MTADWPIDPVRLGDTPQRVLVEAEVYDDPDPESDEPNDRFYTFAISTGFDHNGGRELVSIREDHVRNVVRRIPTPAEPTMVPAHRLKGFEVEVFGAWRRVAYVLPIGRSSDRPGGTDVVLTVDGVGSVTVPAGTKVRARLAEEATS